MKWETTLTLKKPALQVEEKELLKTLIQKDPEPTKATLYARIMTGNLAETVPVLHTYKPLTIGIANSLMERLDSALPTDWSKTRKRRLISVMLYHHTRRWEYLKAVARPDSMRHDLDGQPVEPVLPEHREHAQQDFEAQVRAKQAKQLREKRAKTQAAKGRKTYHKRRPVPAQKTG